jgi:diguanylate cyclase (GGDEF)-like protein/PAS domain S-box-containing protein
VDERDRAAGRVGANDEDFLRAVVDHCSDAVVVVDREGVLRYGAASLASVFAYAPAQLVGTNLIDLVHPEDRADAIGALARSNAAGPGPLPRKVLRVRHGDGSWHWVELSSHNLLDDPIVRGYVVTVRDLRDTQHAEARFRTLLANSSDIISILGRDGVVRWSSAARTRMLGYSSGETHPDVDGRSLVHPDDAEDVQKAFAEVFAGSLGSTSTMSARVQAADGSWRHLEMTATNLLDDPNIDGVVINSRDVTGRVAAEESLRTNEERFRLLVQQAHDAIITVDLNGICTYASPAVTRALGYAPAEMVGADLADQVHPDDYDRLATEVTMCLEIPRSSTTVEYRSRHADGTWRTVRTSFTNLLDEPAVAAVVANLEDITLLRAAEELLEHRATHDPLTDLPNSMTFRSLAEEALRRHAGRGGPVALLFLDLDGFKPINDDIGHREGDVVLTTVANRLRAVVRVGDVVGRVGGDEFCVVCEDLGPEPAVELAQRVREGILQPITAGGREVRVDCSIGVAVTTRPVTLDRLMNEADTALRQAKFAGRGRVELSDT